MRFPVDGNEVRPGLCKHEAHIKELESVQNYGRVAG